VVQRSAELSIVSDKRKLILHWQVTAEAIKVGTEGFSSF
jgi:hypothetical protein